MHINHELKNIISNCDGKFICVCGVWSHPVSREADVLSQAADVHFLLGLTDRTTRKVFIEYLLGRALLAGALLARVLLAGALMALAFSCWSQ